MTRKSCAVGMRNAILRNYLYAERHLPHKVKRICIHFHIRSYAGIMAGNRDLVTNQKTRIALSEVENLIILIKKWSL